MPVLVIVGLFALFGPVHKEFGIYYYSIHNFNYLVLF